MKTPRTPILKSFFKAFDIAQKLESQKGISNYDDFLENMGNQAITRRAFIKNASFKGITSLGLIPVLNKNFNKNKTKIAIVGGGIAGLTAGYYLQKAGISATIFEADKRLGGRIKSAQKFGNGTLTTEIGAEFIDTNHSDMIRLAKDLGLWEKRIDVKEDTHGIEETFFSEGQHYHMKDIVAELRPVIKKIKKDRQTLGDNYNSEQAKVLDNQSLMEYIENLPLSRWVKNVLYGAYIGEQGLDPYELSCINVIDIVDIDKNDFKPYGESDERYKIKGGNQQITEGLGKRLANQIQYEHSLIALKENTNNSIRLSFECNGKVKEETFDAVILAVPFSILRGVHFDMQLTDAKRKVINELAYGANTKLVLEFKDRIWRQAGYRGYFFNEKIHNGWDSTQMQADNKGTGTFTVFLGGEAARKAAKNAESAFEKPYLDILNTAFKGIEPAYTGQTELANWANNPFVKASYSSMGVGQYTTLYGEAGKSVKNLHFVGEHCSLDSWGFMNGGAQTGRLAAQAILKKVLKL